MKKLLAVFTSMRVGLVLMGIIGVFLAVGTVALPSSYEKSLFLKLLAALFCINMGGCTFYQAVGLYRHIRKGGGKIRRKAAVTALHAGLLLILAGVAINSLFGFYGSIALFEGETAELTAVDASAPDYAVFLEDFSIDYNDDGSVYQYNADIILTEGGKILSEDRASINSPLKAQGVKVYLMDYVYGFDFKGFSEDGWRYEEILGEGDVFAFEGTDRTIRIEKYVPNYDASLGRKTKTVRPDNPRVLYTVHGENNTAKLMAAKTGDWIEIDTGIYYQISDVRPYVGFTVKRDPGIYIAAIGAAMLMAGVCFAYRMETSE